MFAISFDMNVAEIRKTYPKHPASAYNEIERTLGGFGFKRIQDSVFASDTEDMSNLFKAILALKALKWFGPSAKNIRAFRMEQGSDFTSIVKSA